MNPFDDTLQLNETIQHVENITKLVTLKFYDPDNETIFDEVIIDLVHGAAQFGDNPNFVDIYNNKDQIYYGAEGGIVYIYFYNEDINNIITIDNPSANLEFAQDYDDEIFEDYDGTQFQIDIAL